jgi:hypothetical protein
MNEKNRFEKAAMFRICTGEYYYCIMNNTL